MGTQNAALRKVGALAGKDFVDLFKNPGMLTGLVLPVAFTALMAFLMPEEALDAAGREPEAAAMLGGMLCVSGIAMTIGMVGSMAILYSLAEEKEKHTLRTLILSNVSAGQIMCAKALVGLAGILLVQVASFLVMDFLVPGIEMSWLPVYLGLGVVGSFTVVLPSLVLGLACRDQMTASFYSVPVVLLAMAPIFGAYGEGIERVVRFTPLGGVCELMQLVIEGGLTPAAAVVPVLVTLAWIVGGAVVFRLLYRRLASDN